MYSISNGMRLEFNVSDTPRPHSGSFLLPYLCFINDLSFLNHPLSWAAGCRWLCLGKGLSQCPLEFPAALATVWCDEVLPERVSLVKLSYLDSWVFSHICHCETLSCPPEGVGEQQDGGVTCQPGPPPPTPEGTATCREAGGSTGKARGHTAHRPCAWLEVDSWGTGVAGVPFQSQGSLRQPLLPCGLCSR